MKQTTGQRDFSKGKMWRNIIAQSVPLIIAQLIQLLYNIVDRIYIGHLPGVGVLALTGVGVTFPIVTLVLAFSYLSGMGGAPLFSIARGAKEDEEARHIMGTSYTLILILAVSFMVVCYIFRTPLLYLFGASDDTIIYAQSYLSIYLIGVIFSMTSTGMNGFISALGYPRTAMWTTVIGALVNLGLDPIFIFALSMGVRGAALATVISQGISAIWVLHFLIAGKTDFHLKLSYMKLQGQRVKKILGLGVSGFTQQATNSLVQIVCNMTLQTFGGDLFVGIMTIINSVREIASVPVIGLTTGSQPVFGFNYGAKEYGRVREGIRFVSLVGILYTVIIWLVLELIPGPFIHIFSSDAMTLTAGIPALRIYFLGFVCMGLQFIGQSVFVGLGKSRRAIFFSLLRKVIIIIPLVILLPRLWGLGTNGVFWAEPISCFIGGTAAFVTMWLTLYRKLPDRGPERETSE